VDFSLKKKWKEYGKKRKIHTKTVAISKKPKQDS